MAQPQQPIDRLAHCRIQMHRVNEMDFRKAGSQVRNGPTDVLESFPEAFPPVVGDQDSPGTISMPASSRASISLKRGGQSGDSRRISGDLSKGHERPLNARVACVEDPFPGNPLAQEI